jgi:hypothetical protein
MVAAAKPFFDPSYAPGRIPSWRVDLAAERFKRRYGVRDPSMSAREAQFFAWLACWRGVRQSQSLQEVEWWKLLADELEEAIDALGNRWALLTLDASYALGDVVGAILEHIRECYLPDELKPDNGD